MRGGGLTGTFIGEPVLVPLLVVALVALLLLWWWWPCEAVPAGGGAKMKGVCTEEEAEVGVQRDDPLLPFWIFFSRKKEKKMLQNGAQTCGEISSSKNNWHSSVHILIHFFVILLFKRMEPVSSKTTFSIKKKKQKTRHSFCRFVAFSRLSLKNKNKK